MRYHFADLEKLLDKISGRNYDSEDNSQKIEEHIFLELHLTKKYHS